MQKGIFWMASAALTLAGCAAAPARREANPVPATNVVAPVANSAQPSPEARLEKAAELLHAGQVAEGKKLLREIVADMPAAWLAVREQGDAVAIAYWDKQEFIECSPRDAERYKKKIVWTLPSYTQAWYMLAFFAIESRDAAEAESDIDQALALEPDRALLLNEKATIVQQSPQRLADAVTINRKAVDSPHCTSAANRKRDLSRAWRSMGVALIDLRKWDEADAALGEASKVDPGNPNTLRELAYLERMRGKNPPPQTPIEIKRVGQ